MQPLYRSATDKHVHIAITKYLMRIKWLFTLYSIIFSQIIEFHSNRYILESLEPDCLELKAGILMGCDISMPNQYFLPV